MTTTQKNIRRMTDTELLAALTAARTAKAAKPATPRLERKVNDLAFETHRRGWGE